MCTCTYSDVIVGLVVPTCPRLCHNNYETSINTLILLFTWRYLSASLIISLEVWLFKPNSVKNPVVKSCIIIRDATEYLNRQNIAQYNIQNICQVLQTTLLVWSGYTLRYMLLMMAKQHVPLGWMYVSCKKKRNCIQNTMALCVNNCKLAYISQTMISESIRSEYRKLGLWNIGVWVVYRQIAE